MSIISSGNLKVDYECRSGVRCHNFGPLKVVATCYFASNKIIQYHIKVAVVVVEL